MATARDRHYYTTLPTRLASIVVAIPCGRHATLTPVQLYTILPAPQNSNTSLTLLLCGSNICCEILFNGS